MIFWWQKIVWIFKNVHPWSKLFSVIFFKSIISYNFALTFHISTFPSIKPELDVGLIVDFCVFTCFTSFFCMMQGCHKVGAGEALASPVLGQTVNPISTRGTNYARHSTMSPLPGFSDLATALWCDHTIVLEQIKTTKSYDHIMEKLVKTDKKTEINKQSDVNFWLNPIKYRAVSYSLGCTNY